MMVAAVFHNPQVLNHGMGNVIMLFKFVIGLAT